MIRPRLMFDNVEPLRITLMLGRCWVVLLPRWRGVHFHGWPENGRFWLELGFLELGRGR